MVVFFQIRKRHVRFLFKIFISQLLLFYFHTPAFSILNPTELAKGKNEKNIPLEEAIGLEINSIHFYGNARTSDDIVRSNIVLKEKEHLNLNDFQSTIQNLKNLQVFSKVDAKLFHTQTDSKKIDVEIELEDKWTLLPYVLAGSGGGSSYFLLGVYDSNFLGNHYTFNFTYGCKNLLCSGYLFFRDPNIFDQRVTWVFNAALAHNVYNIYDISQDTLGSFSVTQTLLQNYWDVKKTPSLSLGAGFLYIKNIVNDNGLSDFQVLNNQNLNYVEPPSTESLALEARVSIGNINYDEILMDGVNFSSILDSTGQAYTNQSNNYTRLNNTLLFYYPLKQLIEFPVSVLNASYLAFRGNFSLTTSNIASLQYFIGGLDQIRGFLDNQFSGKYVWFSNLELRVPSYKNNYIALQHAAFADVGYAAQNGNQILSPYTAMSVGGGVRILFLKINEVALRADYAYTINPYHVPGWSFGLIQFF